MASAGEVIEAWHGARIATTKATSTTSTFTTTETVTDSVTAALVDGERYLVEFWGHFGTTVNGDDVTVQIREDSVSGTSITQNTVDIPTGSVSIAVYLRTEYTAVATGNKTFVATGDRFAGTGNITRVASSGVPAFLTVTHIQEA